MGGRYRIVHLLGRGGMGEVYRADDLKLDVPVALKVLPEETAGDPARRDLFINEVRLAIRVTHPNVCRIHDVGEADGRLFISMEYVDGETLTSLLRRAGLLPLERAVGIARQICDGLEGAHDQGILHRDLKPGNLMLDPRGRVRITDFGLAVLAKSSASAVRGGTPAYMAPELHSGHEATVASDLYALGLVLYELFTGERVFEATSPEELARLHSEAAPTPPSTLAHDLDPAIEEIVLRCLEKDPGNRPTSAQAVAAALSEPQSLAAGTALKTLLLSDLVASTRLVERLGDDSAARLFERHDRLARDLLTKHGGREIDKSDGFLLLFERPIHAVTYALEYHRALADLARAESLEIDARVGVHLGEVVLRTNPPEDVARGAKPLEIEGLAKPTTARLMSLAAGGQTLLTRAAFDVARRSAVGRTVATAELRWLAHGRYRFKGLDEPLEVFEAGMVGEAPLTPPTGSEKAAREGGGDVVLGWRPAPGLTVPQRPRWTVERKLGEGGFGEVWLAAHDKTQERRVFKFCYDAARRRTLQREITLFRLLKEELGERDDIARILDWNFEEAPFFIESEYTAGGNLAEWTAELGGLAQVPMAERLEMVAQVAEALAAAHSVGVLHKDVKPSNVLIHRDVRGGIRALLTDFGVGMVVEPARLARAGITVLGFTETAPGTPSAEGGTRLYTAPEILEGRIPTVQADIYALGIVLYQMVVGDLNRALAPGWRREVDDELLREDIAAAADGAPQRRLGDARLLAERLRTLDERRARRAEAERRRQEAERNREMLQRGRRRRRLAAVVLGAALLFAAAMGLLARRIAQEASRARDMTRVAVAGEWLDRDPTRAAAALLEIEHPERVPRAVARMREVLGHSLATAEVRHQSWVTAASWDRDGQRLLSASSDGTVRIERLGSFGEAPLVYRLGTPVRDAAWSPDGQRAAAAGSDGSVHVWETSGQGKAMVWAEHSGNVGSLSWSPDGRRLATASADGTARIWSLSGDEPIVLEGHEGAVVRVEFDPGGAQVVTSSADGTARIWTFDGREIAVLRGHTDKVWSASFSPGGESVLTHSDDRTARIWNTVGEGEPTVLEGHEGVVYAAKWSPDGARVVTASHDSTARIWNADGSGEPTVLEGHLTNVVDVAWSPDGRRVATASRDGTARVWSLDGKGLPTVLGGHDAPVTIVAFHPMGDHVLTGAISVRVWSLRASGGQAIFAGHEGWVFSARFDPRGERVATASDDGTVRIWDVAGGEAVVLRGHENTVYDVAWSPGGERVASGSDDGTARIWNVADGGEPTVLRGHAGAIFTVSWARDGSRIATASADGTARIWNVSGPRSETGGEPIVLRVDRSFMGAVAWDPSGERVATTSFDGSLRVWDIATETGRILFQSGAGIAFDVAWSPDGERLVTTAEDGTVWIYDTDGREAPRLLGAHDGPVPRAAWSPDGSWIATASWDGTARLWQADGRGDPILLAEHDAPVSGVAFSPDGKSVVTCSADRTARIWQLRLDAGELVEAIRAATTICLVPEFREHAFGEPSAEALRAYDECERSYGRSD